MFQGIDFYSDTLTKPSATMRQAIANAEVGDEQKGEDPTTCKLQEIGAEMFGHTATMFFPTATMANQIAIRMHCQPGDELFAAESSHILGAEAGGPAIHSAVMARPIASENGIFDGEMLKKSFRWSKGPHYPVSKLVCVENTTNMGGGIAWQKTQLDSVHAVAKELGLKTHLDGSRVFNAATATKVHVKEITAPFHTATICLSKGLGCPTGALLAYPKEAFTEVRRLKQLFGGAMRQSGILAAAGIYALSYNVTRLQEDHDNAKSLAQGLSDGIPAIEVETAKDATNMVYFKWKSTKVTAEEFHRRLKQKGVRFGIVDPNRFRAVTHLDISSSDIAKAVEIVRNVCREV